MNPFAKLIKRKAPENPETKEKSILPDLKDLPSVRILFIADLHTCFPEDIKKIKEIYKYEMSILRKRIRRRK